MVRSFAVVLLVLVASWPTFGQTISRPIQLPKSASKAKVGLVWFYSGGHIDRKGKGVAVVDAKGEPVGRRVLANDPDGQTWLAVDLSGGAEGLKLEYDSKPLRSAKVDDKITPSLVLQTYRLRGKPGKKVDGLERVIAGTLPLGTMTASNIYMAHNPFGDSQLFITSVEGLIRVGKQRTLRLFSAHDDVGFLHIDGKQIVRGSKPNISRSSEHHMASAKSVELSPGEHRVRYVHAQLKDRSLAMLGFISGERAVPLPAHFFVHHPEAKLGNASSEGPKPPVGFDARQLDQLGCGTSRVYTRWRLEPIAPAPEGAEYRWNFGDGTSMVHPAAGPIEHVFVSKANELGKWAVTLELAEGPAKKLGSARSRLQEMTVSNVQSARNTSLVRAYAEAMYPCDYRQAPSELLGRLYRLLAFAEEPELVAPLVEACLKGAPRELDKAGWDMRYALAELIARDEPERAAKLYFRLANSSKVDSWKTTCAAAQYIDLAIFRLDRGDQVRSLVYSLLGRRTARERALLLGRLGDVHRLAGKVEEAGKAYQDARRLTRGQTGELKAAVLDRAYREAALDALKHEKHPAMRDVLFQWEADFPTAKLGSDLPLLTGRYFQAVGNEARAAIEFETLLKLNPEHPSRPEIAFRLGQSMAKLGKKDKAAEWFGEVAGKYPNSPFAAEAAAWKP